MGVTQVEQHLGDAAHPYSSDPREVQMLDSKKHFLSLLFRLPERVSIYFEDCAFANSSRDFLQNLGRARRGSRMREAPGRIAHAVELGAISSE